MVVVAQRVVFPAPQPPSPCPEVWLLFLLAAIFQLAEKETVKTWVSSIERILRQGDNVTALREAVGTHGKVKQADGRCVLGGTWAGVRVLTRLRVSLVDLTTCLCGA